MNTKLWLMVLLLGAVFCTSACSGLEPYFGTLGDDDDGVDPTLVSTHWRVVNVTPVQDHWNISELTFYTDNECTNSLSEAVTSILAVAETDCDQGNLDLLNDGECTFSGGCDPGNWANDDGASGPGQIWVGYELGEASPVGCITLCQGSEDIWRVTVLTLEQSNDGGDSWIVVDTIMTNTVTRNAPTVFVPQ